MNASWRQGHSRSCMNRYTKFSCKHHIHIITLYVLNRTMNSKFLLCLYPCNIALHAQLNFICKLQVFISDFQRLERSKGIQAHLRLPNIIVLQQIYVYMFFKPIETESSLRKQVFLQASLSCTKRAMGNRTYK